MIIGLTHTDCEGTWQKEEILLALGISNQNKIPSVVDVNAENSESVAKCLVVLLEELASVPVA